MEQPRDPPAPIQRADVVNVHAGSGRHGPISIVGAPRSSYGYSFLAPPRIWGRGDRNATRQGFSAASQTGTRSAAFLPPPSRSSGKV